MRIETFKGKWALVTGASAGIGNEYARALAELGLNLVILARRNEMLLEFAREMQEKHGVKIIPIQTDLSIEGSAKLVFDSLQAQRIEIHYLVNAAAVSIWGPILESESAGTREMVQVNVTAVIELCCFFLKQRKQGEDAVIVNFSSQASYMPVPFGAIYAGSKAMVRQFSLGLYRELLGSGNYVQTLEPGHTKTEAMEKAGVPKSSKMFLSAKPPRKVVNASLKGLRSEKPLVTNIGGLYFFRVFMSSLPVKSTLNAAFKMFDPLFGKLK